MKLATKVKSALKVFQISNNVVAWSYLGQLERTNTGKENGLKAER